MGLLVVLLASAGVFTLRVHLARASSAPRSVGPPRAPGSALATPTAGRSAFASPRTSSGGGALATATTPTSATRVATVTVHVVGRVRRPGVVTLGAGSRVEDAVTKAGGAARGADLTTINLARQLVDGEQIRVSRPGEGGAAAGGPASANGGSLPSPAAGSRVAGFGSAVDLNQATAAQLEELPGVGPVLAQRIVDYRTEHGRFTTVDELGEVSGIGEKIFAELQPKVTV